MAATLLYNLENKLRIVADKVITILSPKFGVEVNLKKVQQDGYTDLYGLQSGRSVSKSILGSQPGPHTFTSGTNDTLTMSINEAPNDTVIFNSGANLGIQVSLAINAVFPGLATTDFFQQIKLSADTSINIDNSSTALGVLGFVAGTQAVNQNIINILLLGDDFAPVDAFSIGTLREAIVYDPTETVEVGDIISVNRTDGRKREFKVERREALGNTKEVLRRFRVSSIDRGEL